MLNEELIEKQVKNLKRKIVANVWELGEKRTIDLFLFLSLDLKNIPKNLLEKYMQKNME